MCSRLRIRPRIHRRPPLASARAGNRKVWVCPVLFRSGGARQGYGASRDRRRCPHRIGQSHEFGSGDLDRADAGRPEQPHRRHQRGRETQPDQQIAAA